MSTAIPLQPSNAWQFTVDVIKTSAGPTAVLTDARSSLIDGPGDATEKLAAMADTLQQAVEGLRKTAQQLKQPTREKS
jgi:hypothetical protein